MIQKDSERNGSCSYRALLPFHLRVCPQEQVGRGAVPEKMKQSPPLLSGPFQRSLILQPTVCSLGLRPIKLLYSLGFCFGFALLAITPRAAHMVGKCSSPELHLEPICYVPVIWILRVPSAHWNVSLVGTCLPWPVMGTHTRNLCAQVPEQVRLPQVWDKSELQNVPSQVSWTTE